MPPFRARSKRSLGRAQLFDRAHAEGKAARLAGQTRESCPYKPGPYAMTYMGWTVGWESAYDRTSDAEMSNGQPNVQLESGSKGDTQPDAN